jgi:hypothetical protein
VRRGTLKEGAPVTIAAAQQLTAHMIAIDRSSSEFNMDKAEAV